MTRFAAPRAALLPAFQATTPADLERALAEGGHDLESFILKQQLGPTWHWRTQAAPFASSRVNAAMLYLRQLAAQREIDIVLTHARIPYVVIKGAAVRELVYDEPSVRVCCDIDLLVSPETRAAAARALVEAGYRLRVDPQLASHEVLLSRDAVSIDLHWELLRPGRTPPALADEMLARRVRHHDRTILCDADALFVLLVHPVFSKHLSTSQMGLHRLVDLVLWLERRGADWDALYRLLDQSGLKTAVWTMLSLVEMLAPPAFAPVIEAPLRTLRPSAARAAYLRSWLQQDVSARLARLHLARLLGFSMLLHDQPADAWRAFKGWQRSRTSRDADALVFSNVGTDAGVQR